jgi:predicted dehydrogenase
MQLGIHHIDLSQWLLDDDIVEVGARSVSKLSKEFFPADETTVAWTHFSRGAVGSFASSFAFEAHMFFIHGTAGHVGRKGNRIFWEVNQPFDGEAWRCNEACTPGHIEFDWYSSRPARIKPEYEQHRRFALAIRGLAELEASAEVGLKDLLVVEAVHKSAAERIAVAVPSID